MRPTPDRGLWINLWKLWIPLGSWMGSASRRVGRAKIKVMDSEPVVAQTDVAGLPAEFGPGTVLLDVREDDEWQRGHAPDARHIPMGEVPARLNEIDPQATLYVICKAGGRSQKVAQFLTGNGYEPVNVSGGMLAWANAGRPVVTDNGGAGSV
jgi:rhodanese-related sulfurtransferase